MTEECLSFFQPQEIKTHTNLLIHTYIYIYIYIYIKYNKATSLYIHILIGQCL
jgi:hypothetical protein